MKKRKTKKETTKSSKQPPPAKDDVPHNYGGLPVRDLKKNLGCG